MLLELENINKNYRTAGKELRVLDDVSLELKSGEILSVTGKSGCGKSTLLNVITGITRPDSGRIALDGEDLNLSSDRSMSAVRNRKIGQVFQTFNLVYSETVMSNIRLSADIAGSGKSLGRDEIMETLERLEIDRYHNTETGLLSGGQKQRVAVARALVNRPSLILADEPTANLDDATSREIFKIMESLKEEGRGIIIVTHKRYMHNRSDRIYKLQEGKLIEK